MRIVRLLAWGGISWLAACARPTEGAAPTPGAELDGVYQSVGSPAEADFAKDGTDPTLASDSDTDADAIELAAERFTYWPPGCAFAPSCARRGSFSVDREARRLVLRPDDGDVQSVPFTLETPAPAPRVVPTNANALVGTEPTRLVDPCRRSHGLVRLGRRLYESIGTSPARIELQESLERQLRELRPGNGEQGPILDISPANPRASSPSWRDGGRRLFFRGNRLTYSWRRPGGLETSYRFALADSPDQVIAEAVATTRCGDHPLLPQDARCPERTARFRWRFHVALSELDDLTACARTQARQAGVSAGRPRAGLQVLILPMRYDRFGPAAPDTNTFVAYADQLQKFYRDGGGDAVYELVDSAPEDLFARLERYRSLDRRYDRIIFLGHGGGDGLLWDRRWEQIGLNWPHDHPELRTDAAPSSDAGWRWPWSYWPSLVEGREVGVPAVPLETIRQNRPAFDRLMSLTRSLLRPGAWVYLGTCNGGLPSAIDVGRRRPFVQLHACETGATTFGLAGPQAAELSARTIEGLENALVYPPGMVVGSPSGCEVGAR